MNDRAVNLLEQYDIEIEETRKGRDAIVLNTNRGCLILKEYSGNAERLMIQDKLLSGIADAGRVKAERIVPTKDSSLFVKDTDGTAYILKTYFEGRECNAKDAEECAQAVKVLARLHENMELETDVNLQLMGYSQTKEYEKKNRELKRVRKYLQMKSQKNQFEINLLCCYDHFFRQALETTQNWYQYQQLFQKTDSVDSKSTMTAYCHGDYQYHNILFDKGEWFIINFEKCMPDNPIRDLYFFLRKLMEKSNWSLELGTKLIQAYESEQPISAFSKIDLYYRLAYPDKFWKIVNFYYNTGKAWIPERNQEKLEKLLSQEKAKSIFLEEAFRI